MKPWVGLVSHPALHAPAAQEGLVPARGIKPRTSPVAQATLQAPAQGRPYVTLQTVSVRVKMDSGGYLVAKGIFDTGCAISYLSTKLRKAVKPRLLHHEHISYGTFGESSGRSTLAGVYELVLLDDQDQEYPIAVAEVKNIAPPIFRQSVPELDQPPFQGLKFADDYHLEGMVTLDFIIGGDLYWTLTHENDTVRKGGLVAMGSPFGYILSGVSTPIILE